MSAPATRRDRFRQFMENLTATGSPTPELLDRFYVARPGVSVGQRIAKRIELEPTISQLVVGGVGTGKSTQAALAQKLINDTQDARAIFVDVSQHHDLSQLRVGVLTVIAGLAIGRHFKDRDVELEKIAKQFEKWAAGYTEWYEDSEEPYDYDPVDENIRSVRIKPVLVPPERPLEGLIGHRAAVLKELVKAAQTFESKTFILVFDSLDRLSDMKVFDSIVSEDIRAIRQSGVGVVCIGPLPVIFGANRSIADRFDHLEQVPAVDFSSTAESQFLRKVISSRVPEEMISLEALTKLIQSSGGVLRDLILLTKSAAEEAYVSGAEVIETNQVATAADSFGRRLMLGLDDEDLSILRRVKKTKQFVQTSDREVALLVTRRVLEYGAGIPTYAVHPTITPLL